MYILFQILFPLGNYKILRIIPCAVQWTLAGHLFYLFVRGFPDASIGKEPVCNTGETGDAGSLTSIP